MTYTSMIRNNDTLPFEITCLMTKNDKGNSGSISPPSSHVHDEGCKPFGINLLSEDQVRSKQNTMFRGGLQ